MDIILSTLFQGAIWTVMGMGVYITFHILNGPDLSTEASFTLGAAVGAPLLILGVNPLLVLLVVILVGAAAGAIVALMITKAKINSLLAGIITMTGLYSVSLGFMGRVNLSVAGPSSLKAWLGNLGLSRNVDTLVLGLTVIGVLMGLLSFSFRTDVGQALIATGDNLTMAKSLGIPTAEMTMLGYMLGNASIALNGYLVASDNGYADISTDIGSIVIGLAAITTGEVVIPNVPLPVRLLTIFFGSVVYRLLLAVVLRFNFDPNNFKLFSAMILGLCLSIPTLQRYFFQHRIRRGLPRKTAASQGTDS